MIVKPRGAQRAKRGFYQLWFVIPEKQNTHTGGDLAITFGTLNDGTIYASGITLTATGKQLKVTVQNSGYRKVGQ